jgi:hypothetical protein
VKRILALTAVLFLTFSLQAQDIELREDHPREYVVQEGDTLWDIAALFLERPWQWPAIWHANPQIDNPHLIFPGDVISLVFIGGEPRLMVDDSVRRLSPEVRRERLDGPISTIPYDAIEPFLRHPRIISAEEFDSLPYVLANAERRVMTGPGDRTYVRGLDDARVGDEVVVARVTFQFEDRRAPGDEDIKLRRNQMRPGPGQVPSDVRPAGRVWQSTFGRLDRYNYPIIGYEMWEAARARVIQTGDPATLELISGRREVMEGDRVLPVDEHIFDDTFHPRPMDDIPERARVLAISDAYYGVGHYQIVAINLGYDDGVEPGHMFSAFRPGDTIRDNLRYPLLSREARQNSDRRYVTLPEEYAGHLMVFRPFEHISYAIVLDGTNAIRVDDVLDHPDRDL